jgi:hypothetical protein
MVCLKVAAVARTVGDSDGELRATRAMILSHNGRGPSDCCRRVRPRPFGLLRASSTEARRWPASSPNLLVGQFELPPPTNASHMAGAAEMRR